MRCSLPRLALSQMPASYIALCLPKTNKLEVSRLEVNKLEQRLMPNAIMYQEDAYVVLEANQPEQILMRCLSC